MKHTLRWLMIPFCLPVLFIACKKDPVTFNPTNPVSKNFIHVENGKLTDMNSQPFTMRGVSLGGWLMWESWIWGGGFNSETSISNTIISKTSIDYEKSFREQIYAKFITRDDIKAIASMGMNSIRVPFNHRFFDDGSSPGNLVTARFKIIDSLISWCEEFKIYIVLDFHGLPGGQNNAFISDPDPVKVWASDENKTQAVRIWKAIAERYVDKKIILGYDLMNEPIPPGDMDMVNLYSSIIAGIRSVDTNHLLIIEGSNYAQDFSIFNSVMDNNQLFSFHFYPWLMPANARASKLKSYSDFAERMKVPMWCGEWGEMSVSDLQNIRSLLTSPDYYFCGDAFWTWKKVKNGAGSFPLNEIVVSDQWRKLINNQSKTSADSYEEIANSFLSNINYNNNIPGAEIKNMLMQ